MTCPSADDTEGFLVPEMKKSYKVHTIIIETDILRSLKTFQDRHTMV